MPFGELPAREQRVILYGLPKDETVRMRYVSHTGRTHSYEAAYEGVIPNLERRYRETELEWVKQEIERLMMQKPCPACAGKRLKPEFLAVTVDGMSIMDFTGLTVVEALRRTESAAPQRPRDADRRPRRSRRSASASASCATWASTT